MTEVMVTEVPWEYNLSVEKLAADPNGDLYIAGYASNGNVDEDGEVMDLDSLRSVYKQYMENPVIKLMHDKVPQWKGAIGRVVSEYTDVEGIVHKTSFGSKPYLVIKLARGLPEWIYSSVKDGVYKGLSIGGKLAKKVGNRLYVKSWLETSLVDIPSAKGSFVEVLKAAGESSTLQEEEPIKESEVTTKFLNSIQETTQAKSLEAASSGINGFLKGGVGSGIKGHTTYHTPEEIAARRAKYKKDSQELNAKYEEAMGKLKEQEEEGQEKITKGENLINTSLKENVTRGEALREEGRKMVNSSRNKADEFTKKHSEAQAKLSQDLMDYMRGTQPKKKTEPGLSELQASMKVLNDIIQSEGWKVKSESDQKAILNAVQRTQEQIDRIQGKPATPDERFPAKKEQGSAQPAIDKEEAKKQAKRERAAKRRAAKKRREDLPTHTETIENGKKVLARIREGAGGETGTPVGEGSGTSKEEERKAKRKERAAKRREMKKNQSKESEPKKLSGGEHLLKQGYTLSSKGEHLTSSDVKWTKKRLVKNGYEVRVIKTGDNSYDFYVKKDYRKELLAHKEAKKNGGKPIVTYFQNGRLEATHEGKTYVLKEDTGGTPYSYEVDNSGFHVRDSPEMTYALQDSRFRQIERDIESAKARASGGSEKAKDDLEDLERERGKVNLWLIDNDPTRKPPEPKGPKGLYDGKENPRIKAPRKRE